MLIQLDIKSGNYLGYKIETSDDDDFIYDYDYGWISLSFITFSQSVHPRYHTICSMRALT